MLSQVVRASGRVKCQGLCLPDVRSCPASSYRFLIRPSYVKRRSGKRYFEVVVLRIQLGT